ncbi:MAG TPA: isoprenyl transferase [Terriglobales bacterium]|nr:isoprenyl transferase [Terriglobales bacterium]
MWDSLQGYLRPGSEEERLAAEIDTAKLPRHVAVIMDGNGRWAGRRGLARIEGHRAGSESVREATETCARLGVPYLTLYAFSKENWKRPRPEVVRLWGLLREYLRKDGRTLDENDLRFRIIGDRDGIPRTALAEVERLEKRTAANGRMTLVLALNYGSRAEILEAVRRILKRADVREKDLDEDRFAAFLSTAGMPDPDLLIRTSGEMRVSNFLLWQIAYTELWVTPVLWPDFRRKDFLQAVLDYQKRDRRFGDVRSRRGEKG